METISANIKQGRTAEKDVPNPSNVPPSWYDARWEDETEPEWRFGAPAPSTLMPCGCHLRRPDYEAVLCEAHLAELNTRVIPPEEKS